MALATTRDLILFGHDPATVAPLLDRASVRVRGFLRQQVTYGSSTVTLHPPFRLPQRPVRSVESVTRGGGAVAYELKGSGFLEIAGGLPVDVEYTHGFDDPLATYSYVGYEAMPLPDDLVEIVCSIASRIANSPAALGTGVVSEGAGGESVTWGADAYRGVAQLTAAEKGALMRVYPKVPTRAETL